MAKYGMVIDLRRCVGCNACQIACKQVNGLPKGADRTHVEMKETGIYPDVGYEFLPMICMQCENPACVAACPTGASRIGEDGVVYIQKDVCIGCQSCIEVCPYQARTYLEEMIPLFPEQGENAWEGKQAGRGFHDNLVDKCNFCESRRARGEEPACVATCPAGARIFGDLEEEDGLAAYVKEQEAVQPKAELGTEPKVYFIY